MDEIQKYEKYTKLLRSRRRIFYSVAFVVFGALMAQLNRESESWSLVCLALFVVPGFLCFAYYGVMFRLLEQCPWCNKKFMVEPNDLVAKLFYGRKWYIRVSCANCGMPKNKSYESEQA